MMCLYKSFILLLLTATVLWLVPGQVFAAEETVRVSVTSAGVEANSSSYYPSISQFGRYTAFRSQADNLVANDTNGAKDIFLHDRLTGATTRVTVSSTGEQANADSEFCSISHDGRYVAFDSRADNLVPGDTWWQWDIFVHDRLLMQTERISICWNGEEPHAHCEDPSISADGRYVAYHSFAGNIVQYDSNDDADIFVCDRQTGLTELVSCDASGVQGKDHSYSPSISPDGRYVAFYSHADTLVPNDTNDCADIFVKDRWTGELHRASVDSSGTEANHNSYGCSVSDNHRVTFYSLANNLIPNDTNSQYDVFVHDWLTGETVLVSKDSAGIQAKGVCDMPCISADGRYVSFSSNANNLVYGDTNVRVDVFTHDLETGETVRVSVGANGEQGNGDCYKYPAISPDGRCVAFASVSDNLVPNDTNTWVDVFIRSRLSLIADTHSLSASGGTVNFTLDAEPDHASRNYLLLGSVTGTDPGFPLPGGEAVLPLNWDPFTDLVLAFVNSALFSNFMAKLDGVGHGTAQLNAPSLPPAAVGLVMYYAYCLNNPFNFVSNPVGIDIVP